ncbi:MAG TPA: flagellar motor switch protein FliM [Burkholderiales bacterium]|nr:flagellar motor switch protein FliM [Burkholderiales bacterium]
MAKEFLTQDEVDALLRGVTGEAEEEKAGATDPKAPRPYNLAKQERIVRGRMPTFEIINERFARLMRIGLFNFMRRTAEIAVSPVRTQKYSEFIRNLVVPTNLNVMHVKPLRGSALLIFEPTLVFLIIDSLFGGDGRFHARIEGREFTPTEQRIIQRLLEVVFENLEKSWAPVHPLKFEFVRAEMNTQFANIATPNEVVVTTTFTIDFGSDATGAIHLCMPYAMLEPIRDTLFSSVQGEQMELDRRWLRMLSKQVQSAEVQLVANLCHSTLTLEQVLALKTGDVINVDIPEAVVGDIDGVPVMECKYGAFNGQYALQVLRLINHAAADDPPPLLPSPKTAEHA